MAIGIVGFAMVADVLRSKSPQTETQFYTLRDVAEIGLMVAVLSVLPLVLQGFGLSQRHHAIVAFFRENLE